jgi:hypothetical protein
MSIFFSRAMKLLGLIRITTFSLLTIESLLMLQYMLLCSVLNFRMRLLDGTVTITGSNKLEDIQRKLVAFATADFSIHPVPLKMKSTDATYYVSSF